MIETTLFTGPNNAQIAKIEKQKNIEIEYIDFVKNNPNLNIEDYENKYKELNKETPKQ